MDAAQSFWRRRLDPEQRYGLRLTLFALAFVLVAVPFGILLTQVMRGGSLIEIDTSAANSLHEWVRDQPVLVTLLRLVTFLGSPLWFYLIIGTAVIFLWRRDRKRLAVFLVATTLLGGAVDSVVKILVDRPRPSLEQPIATAHGKSFPSGHSMSSVVAYGALLLVFLPAIAKRWRMIVVAAVAGLVLAIGFTRLALGVHYITDVLGGFVLGAAWLIASTAAFSIWRVERGRAPVHPTEGLEPEASKNLQPHMTRAP
ncbi:MAG TPA: phosphatase PAP2 family protein [Actinomycetota bacterium]|nr:phosphatase PAP2 family protein [Actinomycetota bacterium]